MKDYTEVLCDGEYFKVVKIKFLTDEEIEAIVPPIGFKFRSICRLKLGGQHVTEVRYIYDN